VLAAQVWYNEDVGQRRQDREEQEGDKMDKVQPAFRIQADGKQVGDAYHFFTAWVKALGHAKQHPDQTVEIVYTLTERVKARWAPGRPVAF